MKASTQHNWWLKRPNSVIPAEPKPAPLPLTGRLNGCDTHAAGVFTGKEGKAGENKKSWRNAALEF